jgi:hypothetical protein
LSIISFAKVLNHEIAIYFCRNIPRLAQAIKACALVCSNPLEPRLPKSRLVCPPENIFLVSRSRQAKKSDDAAEMQ